MTSPTHTRNPALMNAEPIVRLVADGGVTAALREFASAERHLGKMPMWVTTSTAPEDYRDSLDDLVYAVQTAKQDTRLSNEGKWERIDRLTSAWRTGAEALIARVEKQVEKWESDLMIASRPPAPTTDPMLLEAQLANARQDARMVLDKADDLELADRLAEMARGSDKALAYLVLGDWTATYFRSRGANTAVYMWQQERGQVLASILDEKALQAHERLAGIPQARQAAYAFRLGHSALLHGNPDYFGNDA